MGRALRCSRMHQTAGACSISDRLMHGSTILLLCSGEALDASLCWGDAWGICRHGMAAVCRRPRGRAGATTRAVGVGARRARSTPPRGRQGGAAGRGGGPPPSRGGLESMSILRVLSILRVILQYFKYWVALTEPPAPMSAATNSAIAAPRFGKIAGSSAWWPALSCMSLSRRYCPQRVRFCLRADTTR